ncbi:MAG TPA: recombinase family protein, partial [Phycisphaerae bacterium]|nr:recombinase family protein [Phycisphaerae bacterium]HQE29634.1 recombinase family protein [Phycisphaerae bacterium]
FDPARGEAALATFEFSQNLVPIWRGSNSARKRTILECVSLNRTLTDVTLVLTKRKPFDFLAERPFLKSTRGDWI